MKQHLNIKKAIYYFVMASSLNLAFAEGNGTLGGGEGVYVGQNFEIRDLVDPSTCTWKTGESLLKEIPELNKKLEEIKSLHWFFALVLKNEINHLNFCFTHSQINKVYTGNTPANSIQTDGIMIFKSTDGTPVAIRKREAKEVYTNIGHYNEFSKTSKPLFIIHEALHSFMPLNQRIESYYQRLFSMVKTISKISGDSNERETFELAINKNKLMMPSSAESITNKKYLNYLFSSYQERRGSILSNSILISDLAHAQTPLVDNLSQEYQLQLQQAQEHPYEELFRQFCQKQDESVLNVIRQQQNSSFDVDSYCLTTPSFIEQLRDHPEQFNQGVVEAFMSHFYNDLAHVTSQVKLGRVMISQELNQLSGNPVLKSKYRYALDIQSPRLTLGKELADEHLKNYANILVAAAEVMPTDSWKNFIQKNNNFQMAFNFNRIKNLLSSLESPVEDEVLTSILNIKAVYTTALSEVVKQLNSSGFDDHANALVELINQSNLGINLNQTN